MGINYNPKIISEGLAVYLDAANFKSIYGKSLITGSFPNIQYAENQNVTISTIKKGVMVTSNQSNSTPGLLTLSIPVTPNTRYTLRLKGQNIVNPPGAAYLYATGNVTSNLLWLTTPLTGNLEWKTGNFTTGSSDTSVRVGFLWSGVDIGSKVLIEDIELYQSQTWYDLSGNENNGTLVGGTQYSQENLGVFNFDGTDDYISTSYKIINGKDSSTPITISFWINPNQTQPAVTNNPIWIGSAFYSGFGLMYNGSEYRIWIRMSSGTYSDVIPLVPNVFQNVVLIWGGENDSKIYSYLNSNLNSQQSVTYSQFIESLDPYPFSIGFPRTSSGNTPTGYFNGKISQVSVYNKALTEQEIKQNFNASCGRYGL